MDVHPEAPDPEAPDVDEHAPPRPIDRFRHTAAGTVVAAGLLGLRDALEGRPEREEIAIVSDAPDRLVDDDLALVVDDEHGGRLRVVLPPALDDDRALDDGRADDHGRAGDA